MLRLRASLLDLAATLAGTANQEWRPRTCRSSPLSFRVSFAHSHHKLHARCEKKNHRRAPLWEFVDASLGSLT